MFKIKVILSFIIFNSFSFAILNAQKYVADTLKIRTLLNKSISLNCSLSVNDLRKNKETILSVNEQKKWIFFPVDQIVLHTSGLDEIWKNFESKNSNDYYQINIHEYYINQSITLSKRVFQLDAVLELSRITENDTSLMGSFYYEEVFHDKNKESDSLAYVNAFSNYTKLFINDLNSVCDSKRDLGNPELYHFRPGTNNFRKDFYLLTDAFLGLNFKGKTFYGFDLEMYFSQPEPAKKFNRKSRMFRYLDYENRESVAMSGKVSLFNYRISEKWLFQNKAAFFMGFNKWHDIDEEKRRFEEIFLFQASAIQKIYFNSLDKKGFIVGIGIIEEASYIIYNDPNLSIGGVLSFGYKF